MAPAAFAGGGGHARLTLPTGFHPGLSIGLNESIKAPALGWLFVSFLIYLSIIGYIMYKNLPGFLAHRSELIKRAIEEASQAKKEAEDNARIYEERMAKLDEEINQLREDFATQGKAEFDRIEKSAETAAAKMQKDTEATIDELQMVSESVRNSKACLWPSY